MARTDSFHFANVVRPGICFALHLWRNQRAVSRSTGAGYSIARYLFRRRPLSSDHGGGFYLRHLRGNLLLVPKNVRPHDERGNGALAFLYYADRNLCHFHAHALPRHGGTSAALLSAHGTQLPEGLAASAAIHDLRRVHHHRWSVHLLVQSFLEHEVWQKSHRQSRGGYRSRMDHGNAAAA